MHPKLRFLPFLLLIALAGCAVFESPKTFNERVTYVTETTGSVTRGATSALNAGTLSAKDATVVRDTAQEIYSTLRLATEAFNSGDPTSAQGKLTIAETLLRTIQAKVKP